MLILFSRLQLNLSKNFFAVKHLPFADDIPYTGFWIRVSEAAWKHNPWDTVRLLRDLSSDVIHQKQTLMATYAPLLDWQNGVEVLRLIAKSVIAKQKKGWAATSTHLTPQQPLRSRRPFKTKRAASLDFHSRLISYRAKKSMKHVRVDLQNFSPKLSPKAQRPLDSRESVRNDVLRILLKNVSTSTMQVLSVGHGTTGTHSIYKELCSLGLFALHWDSVCKRGAQISSLKHRPFLAEWLRTNREFVASAGGAARKAVVEQISSFASLGVEAVVDSLTYFVYDELRAVFPDAFVFLTTRSPSEWAEMRVERFDSKAMMCAESAYLEISVRDNVLRQNDGSPVVFPPLPHAYAFLACAERAYIRQMFSAPGLGQQKSVMTSFKDILKKYPNKGMGIIAKTYAEYNGYVRKTAPAGKFIEINLWKDNACAVHERVESLFNNRKVPGSWRGTVVGARVESRSENNTGKTKRAISTKSHSLVSYPCLPSKAKVAL